MFKMDPILHSSAEIMITDAGDRLYSLTKESLTNKICIKISLQYHHSVSANWRRIINAHTIWPRTYRSALCQCVFRITAGLIISGIRSDRVALVVEYDARKSSRDLTDKRDSLERVIPLFTLCEQVTIRS